MEEGLICCGATRSVASGNAGKVLELDGQPVMLNSFCATCKARKPLMHYRVRRGGGFGGGVHRHRRGRVRWLDN